LDSKSTVWATGGQFSNFWWEGLGGAQKTFSISTTTNTPHASLCLVLPPVGSAHSAILLLECIEHFIWICAFSVTRKSRSKYVSPGRLDARRSALLAIRVLLGVGHANGRYTLEETSRPSFAEKTTLPRAGDVWCSMMAWGSFDRKFDWWKEFGKDRLVEPPTDIQKRPQRSAHGQRQAGWTSRTSNLLATLLGPCSVPGLLESARHASSRRRWRHCSSGIYSTVLVDAPWVRTDDPESDDGRWVLCRSPRACCVRFLKESARIKKEGLARRKPVSRSSRGNSAGSFRTLLQKYRSELVRQSQLLDQGGRA